MNKDETLALLEAQMKLGVVSKEDVLKLFGVSATMPAPAVQPVRRASHEPKGFSIKLTNVFYGIGATVVLIGVIILVAQNWEELGFLGRLVATGGIALATYIGGLLIRPPANRVLSQAFLVIAAALSPLAVIVVMNELDVRFTLTYHILTAALLSLTFWVAYWASQRSITILLTVLFGSWAFFALVLKLVEDLAYDAFTWIKWSAMLFGVATVFIGYGVRPEKFSNDADVMRERSSVRGILYGLGMLATLGAGIQIGGVWNFIFIPVLFGAFYLSVYLQSRTILVLATLFLMGHVVKLTAEYFIGSLGWPIALVVSGFIIISIGYGTFEINKRYFALRGAAPNIL